MKILIVSATFFEIKHLVERSTITVVIPNHLFCFRMAPLQIHLLIPGVGLLPTAFYLGKLIREGSFDIALNAGICGAYRRELPLGSILHITEERLPESGVEEQGIFRSFYEVGLMPADEYPFENGKLVNTLIPELETLKRLKRGLGNTVNTLQTDPNRIDKLLSAFPADVESMEGAAFLFACLTEKLPCSEIRAVSNYVGEREKAKWDLRLALKNLDETLMEVLEEMRET
ncbi:MAG: futalosine hydrolase [Bacteroidales bacterium]|nr:futalosine hydrolase [Bacteroidales bacterium]